MFSQGLKGIVDNKDFYSLLNAPREMAPNQPKSSYKRLCCMHYHPDKYSEANRKEDGKYSTKSICILYNALCGCVRFKIHVLWPARLPQPNSRCECFVYIMNFIIEIYHCTMYMFRLVLCFTIPLLPLLVTS